jgi:hypothetical protein
MKKIFLLFIVIILASVGFIRDAIFVNLNLQLDYLYYQRDINYTDSFYLKLFEPYTYQQLYYFKWFLTIVFTFIYFGLGILILKIVSPLKKSIIWLIFCYAFLFIISAVCYIGGSLLGEIEQGYKFARIFMGLLQSPLIIMIIVPLVLFFKEQK